MKLKRIMALVLCFAMVLSTMSFSVFAEEAIMVDSTEAFLTALETDKQISLATDITVETAITVPDDVVIDLNEKTLYVNVENSHYNNVTIKNGNIVLGKDDVHVCDGYFLVNEGKTLELDSVNMSSADGGIKGYAVFHLKTGANLDVVSSTLNISDNEYEAGYIVYANESTATVDINDSTVTGANINGIVHATTIIENSTFAVVANEHGINRSAVTINDSTVTISGGASRGITAQHGDLVINGNSIVNISDMGEATIELRNDRNLTVADTASVNVDVAVNNTTNGTITGTVTVEGASNGEASYVAYIGEQGYEKLQYAIDAVENGNTITLAADCAEDVTVVQATDVAFTIDGANNTMSGTITVDGKSAAYATAGLTIKNVNFDATGIAKDASINLGGSNATRYTSNVTVDNCTFTGTGNAKVAVKNYTGGCKNVTITNCTATGLHSLTQLKTSTNVTVTGCEVTDCKNGISLGSSTGVTISDNDMELSGYGVRADGGAEVTVTDCQIDAFIPVVVRNASANAALTFNGTNTMTESNTDGIWCAIGTSEYESNGVLPTAATASVDVTLNDTGLTESGVYDAYVVPATTHEVSTKAELDAAIAAADEGDIILLTADIDYGAAQLKIEKAITLDLGDKTLTNSFGYGGLALKGGCSIKNGTVAHKGTVCAIKAWDVVLMEDLVIDVAFKEEGKVIGGIVLQENCAGIDTIKNVTIQGAGLMNGIETYNCGNATEPVIGSMENVTIDAVGTGMLISAPCGTATNCDIKGGVSGIEIWIKGTYSASLELVNSDIEGGERAVYAHDEENSNPNIVNNGTITFIADAATTIESANGKPVECVFQRIEEEQIILSQNIIDLLPLEGTGEENEPYIIENLADLKLFRDTVNAGNTYAGKYVKLADDIDLGGMTWTPITQFSGKFNGNDFTISNFKIDATAGHAAFFYKTASGDGVTPASIENLILSDITATVGKNYRVAALVVSYNKTDIKDVTVKNLTVTTTGATSWIAGLACAGVMNSEVTMSNCTVENFTVNDEYGAQFISGITAVLQRNGSEADGTNVLDNLHVKNFKVIVNGIVANGSSTAVGGLVGQTQSVWQNPHFKNCSVTGLDVVASGRVDVGGFMAHPGSYTYVTDCTVAGKIDVTNVTSDANYAGGFFGDYGWGDNVSKGDHKVTNCSADVDIITKLATAGGFVGSGINTENRNKNITLTNCEAKGAITCVEGGTATIGGFAGNTDRGIYINCSAAQNPFIGKELNEDAIEIPVAAIGDVKYTSFAKAVEAANEIEGGATIDLYADVTIDAKYEITGDITISGEHTITRADDYTGTFFVVAAGATLTLDGGLVIDGANNWTLNEELYNKALNREVTGTTWADLITSEEGAPNATAPMFKVTGSVVAKNVTIQNNYSDKSSNNGDYGVFQVDADAALTMTGATIKHIVTGGANSVAHLSTNSVWTINDGTLITDTFAGKNGGICRNDSGMLVMNGGDICTNRGINTNGTVVMLYKGEMEMNGGTICHNTGVSGLNNGRCAPIYGHSTSTFVMNDGTIKENQGISYGGVDVPSSIKVEIKGGYVGDNISSLGNTNADINGNSNTVISGGTFTQDVTTWLTPDAGLAYDEETGTYGLTTDLYEYNGVAYKSLAEVIAAIATTPAMLADEDSTPVVKVLASHKVDDPIVISTNIVLDLNGKTITGAKDINGTQVYPVIRVQDNANVTVKNGTITNADYVFVLGSSDKATAGNLTIESGKYHGATTVASVTKGNLTILGGEFSVDPYEGSYEYLLNCYDASYTDGNAKIVVYGGKFANFNPVNNAAEGANTNFVAEGYTTSNDGNNTWEVIKDTSSNGYKVTAVASATEVRYNNGNPDSFTVKYVATGGDVIGAMTQLEYDNTLFVCAEDNDGDGVIKMNSNRLTTDANGETLIRELNFTVKANPATTTTYKFIAKHVQVVSDYDAAGSGTQDGFVENLVGVDVTVVAQYDVTLPTDGSLSGNTYVDVDTDYSATINNFDENMTYTITYTMGGVEGTVTVTKDNVVNGGFVIEDVNGDIVFTDVTFKLNCEIVLLPEALTGYTLVMVKDGVSTGYTYNGEEMYAIDRYVGLTAIADNEDREAFVGDILGAESVRAILIQGAVTEAEARAAIAASATASINLEKSFDVNGNGQLYFNDAMTAHGCYGKQYDTAVKMIWYLRSDVNTDFMIDTGDYDDTVEAVWASIN